MNDWLGRYAFSPNRACDALAIFGRFALLIAMAMVLAAPHTAAQGPVDFDSLTPAEQRIYTDLEDLGMDMSLVTLAEIRGSVSPGSDKEMMADVEMKVSDGDSGQNSLDENNMAQMAISSMMKTVPIAALMGPMPAELKNDNGLPMLDDATLAFESGLVDLALAHWMGQLAMDPDSMASEIPKVGYCAALHRPVTMIRFGAAISVRSDDGVEPNPLESMEKSMDGGFGQSRFTNDRTSTSLSEEEEMMMASKSLGEPMEKSMSESMASDKPVVPLPASLDGEMVDSEAAIVFDETIGLVGQVFADSFLDRLHAGQFGRVMIDKLPVHVSMSKAMMKDEPGNGQDVAPEASSPGEFGKMMKDSAATPSTQLTQTIGSIQDAPQCWIPCVDFVGEMRSDEALGKARQKGLDFLFQFDVTIRRESGAPRGSTESDNITRIRVYDVRSGKSLYSTRSIGTSEARRALFRKQYESSSEFVSEQTKAFWSNFDRAIHVVAMPTLDAEKATRRVGQIMASPSRTLLDDLGEVQVYRQLNLLDEQQVEQAFAIMAGQSGLQMLYAAPSAKQSAARQLIRQSFGQTDSQ